MDPLAWLGLKKQREAHPRLSAINVAVRDLLPEDEPVVLRYIVIVAVLLTRVAHADGVFLECELTHLRQLFQHIDRMPPDGINTLCATLNENAPTLSDDEIELCYRELKSLCDADERLQVIRLLAGLATADGGIVPSEHGTLMKIAAELGVPEEALAEVEEEALTRGAVPTPPASLPPPPDSAVDPADR